MHISNFINKGNPRFQGLGLLPESLNHESLLLRKQSYRKLDAGVLGLKKRVEVILGNLIAYLRRNFDLEDKMVTGFAQMMAGGYLLTFNFKQDIL
ncbi:hypothetical protein L6452_05854 [Arctium lappa]|uniref:Uncharacterized protein n=1 Tax=Arctium lappa TaxID=4217 RepID=A0ACB9EHK6_ARCLA|nr:hypothetical protein L6452_05854 [Arctium lappa]